MSRKSLQMLPINRLYRYTTLPVLLDILTKKGITLVSPADWEDRNDAAYLERYRRMKNLKTVLAVCFTLRPETFHHWKIFANGSSGVCIEFDKRELLLGLKKAKGIFFGPVVYKLIKEVQKQPVPIDELPFVKRRPFDDEREFRVVYESAEEEVQEKTVPFASSAIRKVTLSPWLPVSITETIREIARHIDGCAHLPIARSTLIKNLPWLLAIKT